MPSVISLEEAKELDSKGKQVILFPRNVNPNFRPIPSDGQNQHYYTCKNPNSPYPGLQVNKLENSDEFPYVPCCFSTSQIRKKAYQEYYYGKEKSLQKKVQQEIIKTGKILGRDKYGNLPEELSNFFRMVDEDDSSEYLRMGVDRNMGSFLSVVLTGMFPMTGFLSYKDERDKAMVATRNNISKMSHLARQCIYDMSSNEISQRMQQDNFYLQPNMFVQMFETLFECNIFLFNQSGMILPRTAQNYCRSPQVNKPCLFVYEHWGSESDHAKYPQSDLIVKWKKGTPDTTYFFGYTEKVSVAIRKLFSVMTESYVLDKPFGSILFFPQVLFEVKSQKIDTYGKCRQLNCKWEGKRFTILCNPIQPQNVPEKPNSRIRLIDAGTAFKIAEQGELVGQNVSEGVTNGVIVMFNNVRCIIPIQPIDVIEDIPSYESVIYPDRFSILSLYTRNKKIAGYLSEYFIWLFSKYIEVNRNISDQTIDRFVKSMIEIDEKFEYGDVRKTYEMNSGVMRNGKLVVPNMETLKRLVYVLKLFSIRNSLKLIQYKDRRVIQNYYSDVTDFKQNPRQVILYGEDSIEKWVHENSISYKLPNETFRLYSRINIGSRIPYFFKNDLIDNGQIFLAQNIDSVSKALYLAMKWQTSFYNTGFHAKESKKEYEFTLYSYESEKSIRVYEVIGDTPPEPIRIIGYKIENPFFTVLFSLE